MLVRNKDCLCNGGCLRVPGISDDLLGISADLDAQFPDSWRIPLPNGLGGNESLGTKSKKPHCCRWFPKDVCPQRRGYGTVTGGNMIRRMKDGDLTSVAQIWLDANVRAHNFVPEEYWTGNYEMVREALNKAELYVYEEDGTDEIGGFIGLTGNYIAGIFVREAIRSRGIGKQLLDYVKAFKPDLGLNVYQKNPRAVSFYQRERFVIQSESLDEGTNEKEFFMVWKK